MSLRIRFFTISMSLLIAFAQCGVGVSSILCVCTGEKAVSLFSEAKIDCALKKEEQKEKTKESCCSKSREEPKHEVSESLCLEKSPCAAKSYEYAQSAAIGFIPDLQWSLSLDLISFVLSIFSFTSCDISLLPIVQSIDDRGPPIRDVGHFLSLIQSYLL
ncbi:MAG: hypothetical protein ABIV51_08055 [Saprospiraceae bacterium]